MLAKWQRHGSWDSTGFSQIAIGGRYCYQIVSHKPRKQGVCIISNENVPPDVPPRDTGWHSTALVGNTLFLLSNKAEQAIFSQSGRHMVAAHCDI